MREYKVGDTATWEDGNPAECVALLDVGYTQLAWVIRNSGGDWVARTDRNGCSGNRLCLKQEQQKLYVYRSDCGMIRAFDSGGPRRSNELIATTTFTEGAFVDDEDNE